MKSIILAIIMFLFSISLLGGCIKKKSDFNYTSDKSIFLSEGLDFKKEVLFTATGMADYAFAAPRDSKELYETSKNVVTGKVIASELCINKESGFSYTLVKFHRDELIKGNIENKEFTVAYIGGYMSGKKYMEIHPDFKMSIIKGVDENQARENLKNTIIKVGGMPGEVIPKAGKSYLLFLAPHNLKIEDNEYYCMAGYEFAQGLFEINNGRVRYFSPEARVAAFYKGLNSKLTDGELLDSMQKSTEEIDIVEFINKIKER